MTSKKIQSGEKGVIQLLWDLNECRMMPTDFRSRMSLIGLPKEFIDAVPSFDENKAVRSGAKKWRKGRGEVAYEGTVAYENDDYIGVAVLELQRVNEKEVQKKQVDSWAWDKANLTWHTNPQSNEGVQLLQFIERQLKGFSSNEVTTVKICAPHPPFGARVPAKGVGCLAPCIFIPFSVRKLSFLKVYPHLMIRVCTYIMMVHV